MINKNADRLACFLDPSSPSRVRIPQNLKITKFCNLQPEAEVENYEFGGNRIKVFSILHSSFGENYFLSKQRKRENEKREKEKERERRKREKERLFSPDLVFVPDFIGPKIGSNFQ